MAALSKVLVLIGIILLVTAKGAIHEIEAVLLFVIAAILYSSARIIAAIQGINKRLATEPLVEETVSEEVDVETTD